MNQADAIKLRLRGLSIFPVSNDTKIPLIEWKRLQTELPTLDEVKDWFSINNRSIGVAMGSTSGLFLLDFDFTKHPESRVWYDANYSRLPRTWSEKTKSGGLHLYFKWTPALDKKKTNTTGSQGDSPFPVGVDTKGQGGYSKITPSEGYEWINPPHLTVLATPPDWLLDMLPSKQSSQGKGEWITDTVTSMQDGNRKTSLMKLAGSMLGRQYTPEQIFLVLEPLAQRHALPKEDWLDIQNSIRNYYKPTAAGDIPKLKPANEFLKHAKPPNWICSRFFATPGIHFVAGLNGTLKTWMLMDLAAEIARNNGKWLGRYPVKQGKVIFLDQERHETEGQRRLAGILSAKNFTEDEKKIVDQNLFLRCGSYIKIDEPLLLASLEREILEIMPSVLIIDSFATLHSKNEISRQEIQPVMEILKRLRDKYCLTIIIINHENNRAYGYDNEKGEKKPPTTGEMAGNEAIPAAAEAVLTVRRFDSESCIVYTTKNNLCTWPAPFNVKVNDVENGFKVEAF